MSPGDAVGFKRPIRTRIDPPLRLHHLLTRTVSQRVDQPALSDGAHTLTYPQLTDLVRRVGGGLRGIGVQQNDRVAVYLDKRIETVGAIFGTAAAGGVFVPINPVLRPRQVLHILTDCQAHVLVTSAERYAQLRPELQNATSLRHVVVVNSAEPTRTDGPRVVTGWEALTADALDADGDGVDVDMCAILYTSGSTGKPKGVVLSHRNLLVGASSVAAYLGNDAPDVILAALPLSFDAGFSQLTTAFHSGAHAVLLNYLRPADVVRACEAYGVTGLTCVPPLWIQIAEANWPQPVADRLRYFANTGGRMPKATLDRLRGLFPNARPFLMYGLTEAFRSTYLDPSEVDRRPDSIGKGIPNADIRVVRQDGSECDAGEEGELVHRGALVAMGYWNDPERTAARFRPAPGLPAGLTTPELAVWSGDAVVRDDQGFLYFVGRKDEMIKTSGYRVSPAEIEEVAYETGLVRDAVALGLPDETLGQCIVLVVAASPGREIDERLLLTRFRQQLPLYMVPRRVVVRAELPRSPNGKFDRTLLREELGG